MRVASRTLMALLVLPLLAACASSAADGTAAPGSAPADGDLHGTLTVLAAASLTDVAAELEERFERLHPTLDVRVSAAGSGTLAQQVLAGAPADVLVTADRATMRTVTDAGLHAAPPAPVARNALVLAVPRDDPGGVDGLDDLARDGVTFAACAVEVPCGAAAHALLRTAGVTATPVTYERDVRAVLTKVRLGEVDAGLVYRTDVAAAAPDVVGVLLAGADAVADDYVVAPLAEAPNPRAAEAFVAFLLDDEARAVLDGAGFVVP